MNFEAGDFASNYKRIKIEQEGPYNLGPVQEHLSVYDSNFITDDFNSQFSAIHDDLSSESHIDDDALLAEISASMPSTSRSFDNFSGRNSTLEKCDKCDQMFEDVTEHILSDHEDVINC